MITTHWVLYLILSNPSDNRMKLVRLPVTSLDHCIEYSAVVRAHPRFMSSHCVKEKTNAAQN